MQEEAESERRSEESACFISFLERCTEKKNIKMRRRKAAPEAKAAPMPPLPAHGSGAASSSAAALASGLKYLVGE